MFNTSGIVATEPVGAPFVDARAVLAAGMLGSVEVATVVAPAFTYMENAELIATSSPPPLQIVAGPEVLTGDQVAKEFSAALGREMRWTTIDFREYERMLVPHVGAEVAAGIAAGYAPGTPLPPAPAPEVVRTGAITLREWAVRQSWDQI
ncbi:hypothetical protein SBI_08679 [Streptomyces bingchenggensis BCW-1]|uniref:NmrA family protein n=1 Tax=Streptomyces bingchenggensis (strain BCW-1) TaxID=749414 RepID=D7BW87_STRBB|nr:MULTISPECIES: hypothetical protein [Streptomyces]ADI11797.1 hypothetical protein SBI_08679 [Streptomyces bingchenggensis BCW-1]